MVIASIYFVGWFLALGEFVVVRALRYLFFVVVVVVVLFCRGYFLSWQV